MRLPLRSNYDDTRYSAESQQTLNIFPNSKMGYGPFPGLVSFADFMSETEALNDNTGTQLTASGEPLFVSVSPGGNDRGMHVMNGILYIVSGPSLFSVNISGVTTFIGAITNSPQRVVMSDDNTELVITTGDTAYSYTTAGGLEAITDGDLGVTYTHAYLDSRRVYDQPNGQFITSDLNDGTSVNALNFATAEAFGDDLQSIASLNQLAYLLGKESSEIWYTSGVGFPPLDRQAVIKHGIAGRYARGSIDDRLYFIDHERAPSMMQGTQYAPLLVNEAGRQRSTAIGVEWDSYSAEAMAAALVHCYSFEQSNFVDFIFPTISKTWTYHESTGEFFERTFLTTSVIKAYNKTLMADYSAGKLYQIDPGTYQNNGVAVTRIKDLPMISAESLGADGRDITLDELRINYDASASSEISVYLSKDLETFTNPRTFTVSGKGRKTLTNFGEVHEGIVRIETSANAEVNIVDASAEITLLDT